MKFIIWVKKSVWCLVPVCKDLGEYGINAIVTDGISAQLKLERWIHSSSGRRLHVQTTMRGRKFGITLS
jgi:hypothetical protein